MNLDEIYVKTELGTKELVERRLGLAIDVRRLLILVDGKHTVAQILARGRAFHADAAASRTSSAPDWFARLFGARSTPSRNPSRSNAVRTRSRPSSTPRRR